MFIGSHIIVELSTCNRSRSRVNKIPKTGWLAMRILGVELGFVLHILVRVNWSCQERQLEWMKMLPFLKAVSDRFVICRICEEILSRRSSCEKTRVGGPFAASCRYCQLLVSNPPAHSQPNWFVKTRNPNGRTIDLLLPEVQQCKVITWQNSCVKSGLPTPLARVALDILSRRCSHLPHSFLKRTRMKKTNSDSRRNRIPDAGMVTHFLLLAACKVYYGKERSYPLCVSFILGRLFQHDCWLEQCDSLIPLPRIRSQLVCAKNLSATPKEAGCQSNNFTKVQSVPAIMSNLLGPRHVCVGVLIIHRPLD